jgi:hypothetical protein
MLFPFFAGEMPALVLFCVVLLERIPLVGQRLKARSGFISH